MSEKKISVTMTASGRAKEYPAGADIREILETIYSEHQTAGSAWDRPIKLFVAGERVVTSGLTDLAWEYGKFRERQEDMVEELLDDWVEKRFSGNPTEAA